MLVQAVNNSRARSAFISYAKGLPYVLCLWLCPQYHICCKRVPGVVINKVFLQSMQFLYASCHPKFNWGRPWQVCKYNHSLHDMGCPNACGQTVIKQLDSFQSIGAPSSCSAVSRSHVALQQSPQQHPPSQRWTCQALHPPYQPLGYP